MLPLKILGLSCINCNLNIIAMGNEMPRKGKAKGNEIHKYFYQQGKKKLHYQADVVDF